MKEMAAQYREAAAKLKLYRKRLQAAGDRYALKECDLAIRDIHDAETEISRYCDKNGTVSELQVRKIELLCMRGEEMERRSRGEGDNMNLFVIEEEIRSVNSRLRAFGVDQGGTRRRRGKESNDGGA